MNNQWEEDIRRKLEGLEEPSPQLSWSEIDKALASRRQSQRARIVSLRQYRRMIAAAVVALVVAGAAVLFMENNGSEDAKTIAETASVVDNIRQKTASGRTESKDDNDTPASVANSGGGMLCLMTAAKPCLTHGMGGAAAEEEQALGGVDARQVVSPTAADSTATTAKVPSDETKTVAQSQQERSRQDATVHEPRQYHYGDLFAEADVPSKHTGGKSLVDLKTYVSNAALNSNASSVQPLMLASASPYGNCDENMNGNSVSTVNPKGAEEQCDIRHSQPVRLGVEVGFRLTDRLTLTTGLSYSLLRSDIDRTIGTERSTTVQRLHYIGIPIGVNYSLWRNRKFNVYVGGGGMVERMVSGKAVIETAGQGQQSVSVSERISSARLQFSVHASAGAEYFFLPNAGLFVEPGVSYHFNNGSGLSTIYSDKPLNLNLGLGLRFDF